MDCMDRRAQVLANCKFLYGPETEVISLNDGSGYQAVAARFDRSTGLMSVFLHSNPQICTGTFLHIEDLLRASETEITKRFSQDGVDFPFSKEHDGSYHDLHMPLHHKIVGCQKTGTSISSEASGSSFENTPTSSIAGADTVGDEGLGYTYEATQSARSAEGFSEKDIEELGQNSIQPALGCNGTGIERSVDEQDFTRPLTEPVLQRSGPYAQSSELDRWNFGAENKKANDKTTSVDNNLMNELVTDARLERQERSAGIVGDDAWAKWKSAWTTTTGDFQNSCWTEEGKRQKNKKVTISPVPELGNTPETQSNPANSGGPESSVNEDVSSRPVTDAKLEEQENPTDFADDDFDWGTFKKSKKGRKKAGKISIDFPIKVTEPMVDLNWMNFSQKPEPQRAAGEADTTGPAAKRVIEGSSDAPISAYFPELTDDVPVVLESVVLGPVFEKLEWNFPSKKSDKKKGKLVTIEDPVVESEVVPEAWPGQAADDGWGRSRKDKKKRSKLVTSEGLPVESEIVPESELELELEPVTKIDDPWASFGFRTVKKKKKQVAVREPLLEPGIFPEPGELEPDPIIDDPWASFASFGKKQKKKNKKPIVEDLTVAVETLPEAEPQFDEAIIWKSSGGTKERKNENSKKDAPEDPIPEPVKVQQSAADKEAEDDFWGSLGGTKKRRKKSKQVMIDELIPGPKETQQLVPKLVEPLPDDFWSFGCTKEGEKRCKKVVFEEWIPEPGPGPEPVSEEWNSGPISGKKAVIETSVKSDIELELECELELERELEREIEREAATEEYGWGAFSTKKDKKMKKQAQIESPPTKPVIEPSIELSVPAEELEAISDDFGWGFKPRKNKKKKVDSGPDPVIEAPALSEPENYPEPEPQEFGWGSLSTHKKDEKKKRVSINLPSLEKQQLVPKGPEPEQVSDNPWSINRTKPKKMKKVPIELPNISEQLKSGNKTSDYLPLPYFLPKTADPRIPKGHIIVLKILYYNLDGKEDTLRTMIRLYEDTPQGIFDAATAFINTVRKYPKYQRWNYRILRAAGKDGMELELLNLDDEMWPECLEYFRQYTKVPELTIEAVEVTTES